MSIAKRIALIKEVIKKECIKANRSPDAIKLLAVSKGHPVSAIQEAAAAGVTDVGENYLQEAVTKIDELSHLNLCWHFIGKIQKNKAKSIAKLFSWAHCVTDYEVASLLNDTRPLNLPKLNICIQVNLDREENKSGIYSDKVQNFILQIKDLPRLEVCGLMTIPKYLADHNLQYASLLRLKNLLDTVNEDLGLQMKTLSMGMSQDMIAAIHAGSTILRIGTAIFGERKKIN